MNRDEGQSPKHTLEVSPTNDPKIKQDDQSTQQSQPSIKPLLLTDKETEPSTPSQRDLRKTHGRIDHQREQSKVGRQLFHEESTAKKKKTK